MSYVVNSKGLLLYYKSYYSLRGVSVIELGAYQYQVKIVRDFTGADMASGSLMDLDRPKKMRTMIGTLLVAYTNRGTRG